MKKAGFTPAFFILSSHFENAVGVFKVNYFTVSNTARACAWQKGGS
jgi:hypothetical protein